MAQRLVGAFNVAVVFLINSCEIAGASSGNVGGKLVFRAKIGGSPQDALERTRRQAHALLGVPRTSMELK